MFSLILLVVFGLFLLFNSLNTRLVYKHFEQGNCLVYGLRGDGKDLLFSFITNRQVKSKIKTGKKQSRSREYISNVDYTANKGFNRFDPAVDMSLGGNDFHNFINNDLKYYDYPYKDDTDYFISDAGVYFPSQYNGELDKKYKSMPLFQALSRHLGKANVHSNVQNLNRLWIKIREQSDIYIHCRGCRVRKLFGNLFFVKQKLTIYDNLTSAEQKRPPFPLLLVQGKEGRMRKAEYKAKYGSIRKITICYLAKLTYDDRIFKTMLLGGKKIDQNL